MTSTIKKIPFTKMHGLGNDFVIINALNAAIAAEDLPIQQMADRHRGIGFDQLLLIEPGKQVDFYCRIFNADGSEAEQCGNGLRCVARFVHEEKLTKQTQFCIATKAGLFPVQIMDYDHICVVMGKALIQEKYFELPALAGHATPLMASILSLGNPHTIIKVDSIDTALVSTLGPKISTHAFFPEGTNVGFMQIINPQHLRLRTYERGAGETLACGSNACAAVCAGIINHWLDPQVKVEVQHGFLFGGIK